LLTPYWDPEGGFAADVTYQYGLPIVGNTETFQQLYGQFSFVKPMPHLFDWLGDGPVVSWLNDTRWAFRVGGAGAVPTNGQFFTLGGGNLFRGFGLDQRQGNAIWVGSVEWRVPVLRDLDGEYCDHVAGLRNVFLAPFYDAGACYLEGQRLGNVAQALGVGLRLDVTWLGMIERTTVRLDFAKTINAQAPWQFWFGVQHPF
jgi:hemolysin activation/secretion protein